MSKQFLEEKYFTATFDDGRLEAVCWHKTLKEAKEYAKKLRKLFPQDEIIVGERIE
jgi:hypothetical protein